MRYINIILSSSIVIFATIGCKKQSSTTCNGTSPTYNSEIKTIINNNCMPCHGQNGNYNNYTTYAKLQPILSNGKFKSLVLTNKSMPTNKNCSNSDLSTIQCWVDNNYLEN